MSARDPKLIRALNAKLTAFSNQVRSLPGVRNTQNRDSLVRQFIDSIHRVQYIRVISRRKMSVSCADANSDFFDPIKAAILKMNEGKIDEAFWFVFLSVHFGKNRRSGYRLARDIYGSLGKGSPWDWEHVSANPHHFRKWLEAHQARLKTDGVHRAFGNHRKYQSLDAESPSGTGAAVETYVRWIAPPRTHFKLVMAAVDQAQGDRRKAFDLLFDSMASVASFGRTARFDYLTMVGKLNLAPIEPGSTYMHGATGPLDGARLLFGEAKTKHVNRATFDRWLVELGTALGVGMQEMEDALCNWQKSPSRYKRFRG